jgi:hypothetical protein
VRVIVLSSGSDTSSSLPPRGRTSRIGHVELETLRVDEPGVEWPSDHIAIQCR